MTERPPFDEKLWRNWKKKWEKKKYLLEKKHEKDSLKWAISLSVEIYSIESHGSEWVRGKNNAHWKT